MNKTSTSLSSYNKDNLVVEELEKLNIDPDNYLKPFKSNDSYFEQIYDPWSLVNDFPENCFMYAKNNWTKVHELESCGIPGILDTVFVYIAGGVGERLQFETAKVLLPLFSQEKTVLECMLRGLSIYQKYHSLTNLDSIDVRNITLVIIVSNTTEKPIRTELDAKNYYGLNKANVRIIRQTNGPCLINKFGKAARNPLTNEIITRPIGHGDVHRVLYKDSWFMNQLKIEKKKYVMFLQDVNVLALKIIPSMIGRCIKENLNVCMATTKNSPSKPLGIIAPVVSVDNPNDKRFISIEYNLRQKWLDSCAVCLPEWNEKRFAENTNLSLFVLESNAYIAALENTGGGELPFMINPGSNLKPNGEFTKPIRPESLVQDILTYIPENCKWGIINYPLSMSYISIKEPPKTNDFIGRKSLEDLSLSLPNAFFSVQNSIAESKQIAKGLLFSTVNRGQIISKKVNFEIKTVNDYVVLPKLFRPGHTSLIAPDLNEFFSVMCLTFAINNTDKN